MRPSNTAYNAEWSPRSREPPVQSQFAYSLPAGANPSSYGDYFNNNLPAVDDLGPLQQYIDSYNDPYVEPNMPNLSHFTNSVATDQEDWFQTPQSHAEYNEVVPRSMAEPNITVQTGGETAGPQQELPGTFLVLKTCTMASITEEADTHCDYHVKLTDLSRRVRGLVIWPLSGLIPEF
jgi:hypothetical protein